MLFNQKKWKRSENVEVKKHLFVFLMFFLKISWSNRVYFHFLTNKWKQVFLCSSSKAFLCHVFTNSGSRGIKNSESGQKWDCSQVDLSELKLMWSIAKQRKKTWKTAILSGYSNKTQQNPKCGSWHIKGL